MRERVDEDSGPDQGKMMCNGGIPGVDDEKAEECMYAEDGWPRMDDRETDSHRGQGVPGSGTASHRARQDGGEGCRRSIVIATDRWRR